MKSGKAQSITKKIRDEIYDPGHRWKYDLWPLKLLALFFIIVNFQWLNEPPITKLGLIAITESLFLIYTVLFLVLFKNKISFSVQLLSLVLDLLFIAFFDYLSLSFFSYNSRVYALYLIPIIYCCYWFKGTFTLIFVIMVTAVYTLLNFYTPTMGIFYTTWGKFGKLIPIIGIFYLSATAVFFYKKKIQRDFIDVDPDFKERAEKLEQIKESTQALLKDKIDGFMAIDEKGNITETNQLARELLGYKEKEIYKLNVKKIYGREEASRIMRAMRKSPEGTIYNFKTWMQSKDKEKIPHLLSASLLYDRGLILGELLSKGEKFPSIGYFRDIRAEDIFDNIARDITAITNERTLLDKIVEIVAKTIKSETCCILIYNENSGLIEVFSKFGFPIKLNGDGEIEFYDENESLTGKVFDSGKTLNISNIDVKKKQPGDFNIKWSYAEKFAKCSRFGDFKHFLGTPLRIQGEVYGVIRVLNKYKTDKKLDKQGFTNKDILLLKRISNQVSILVEKVRNKDRFEAISRVGIELNAKVNVELDDLLVNIARGVVEGMKFKACFLRMVEGNKLKIKAFYGLTGEYKDEKFTLKIGEGISGKVVEKGEKKIVEDIKKEKNFKLKELLEKEELTSMLSIPLKYHGRVIGVISCYTRRKHQFTDQEIQITETFAVYAAVAIRNKKRMDELKALNEIGNELVKPIKIEELFDLILKKAKILSGADCLCIKSYDERNGELKTVRVLNCKWYEKNEDYTINVMEGLGAEILGEIIKTGTFRIIPNYDEIRNDLGNVPGKNFFKEVKSCALVPIKIDKKIFGIIFLDSYKYNFFTGDDLSVLEAFSTQAAIALKNANFFNKFQRVTETFPKISELHVDIDKVLKSIVEIAAKVLETDILILYLYDEKQKKIKWPPIHSGEIKYREFLESEDISSDKPLSFVKRGTSHYANKSQEDSIMNSKGKPHRKGVPTPFVFRENITSSAGIVLKVGREIVGVMFINYRTPHEFDIDEQQIIEIFASYIAVAIQNVVHFSEKKTADTMNTIGKLSTNFAHKIKNDIATINLYTGGLIDKTEPEAPQYFPLTKIKEKIQKITKDIEFLSRTSKMYVHEKKLIHIDDLIDELKSEILPDLKIKKITLEIEIQPGLPKLEIDPTQMKMVFINLAQNSMDAMPKGGKVIFAISKSNKNLVFHWTDTGCGIPSKYANKIFDVLWSTKDNGSGLGLFYAKTIIEEHGGSISLDTTHKKGTRFVIIFPVKELSDLEI